MNQPDRRPFRWPLWRGASLALLVLLTACGEDLIAGGPDATVASDATEDAVLPDSVSDDAGLDVDVAGIDLTALDIDVAALDIDIDIAAPDLQTGDADALPTDSTDAEVDTGVGPDVEEVTDVKFGDEESPDADEPDVPVDQTEVPDLPDVPDAPEAPDGTEVPDAGADAEIAADPDILPDVDVPSTPDAAADSEDSATAVDTDDTTTVPGCVFPSDCPTPTSLCETAVCAHDGTCTTVAANCNDANTCTLDACNPTTGCVFAPADPTVTCDDGSDCTVGDTCQQGTCAAGVGPICDDNDLCTLNTCDPQNGCVYLPNATTCTDGVDCTVDTCDGLGGCTFAADIGLCSDGKLCTDDVCDKVSGCSNPANTLSCDDGNPCTTGDTCGSGACQTGTPKTCDDLNPCTVDTCNPQSGTCGSVAGNGGDACEDGSKCTTGDKCSAGSCLGVAKVCVDGNACTDDGCEAALGCTFPANAAVCADATKCVSASQCNGTGSCVAGVSVNCDDGNPCTADACSEQTGLCGHESLSSGACDDGNACTTGEACSAGMCVVGLVAANVATVAGSGVAGGQDGPGSSASFKEPYGIARLPDGSMAVSNLTAHTVRLVMADGTVSTLAGVYGVPGNADGPSGTAMFTQPAGLAAGKSGEVYVADYANHRIRKIAGGVVTTVAGTTQGFKDGAGAVAQFNNPTDVEMDAKGQLWVADQGNHCIRRIAPDGTVVTVAGTGGQGYQDGPALSAKFNGACRLAIAPDGTVYIGDCANAMIRKLSADGSSVATVAGSVSGYLDGVGTAAKFTAISGLTLVGSTLIVADRQNNRLRAIGPDGTVTTVAGSGAVSYVDGAPTSAAFATPWGLATAVDGSVWIADAGNTRIRKLTFTTATCNDGNVCTSDSCAANVCTFTNLDAGTACQDGTECTTDDVCTGGGACVGVAKDCDDDNPCTTDYCNPLTLACSEIAVANFTACSDGSACTSGDTCFSGQCMASPVGTVGTIAGSGVAGYLDGASSSAQFKNIKDLVLDGKGGFIVADYSNNIVRRVDALGNVSTVAGSTTAGDQDGPTTSAQFRSPHGVLRAPDGGIYVSEGIGNRIRYISTTSAVTTIAGSTSAVGGLVDGQGTSARFSNPVFMTFDPVGNLVVADYNNNAVRRVTPAGLVSTLVGGIGGGWTDGPTSVAKLSGPSDVAFDPTGNLYICELGGHRIRRLGTDGIVTTILGTGAPGFGEGNGTAGILSYPFGIQWHPSGFLLIGDGNNNRVRALWTDGTNTTVAGNGTAGYLDGAGLGAALNNPQGIAIQADGSLAVGDNSGNRIRKITLNQITCNDNLPCTADSCNPATGACMFAAIPDGGGCTDGNACTVGDTCTGGGVCVPGPPVDCDDGESCTQDECNPWTAQCEHTNTPTGTNCGVAMACFGGTCGSGCTSTVDCAPGLICHANATSVDYCNDTNEDFSSNNGTWKFTGTAYWDAAGQHAVLTKNTTGNAGNVWYASVQKYGDLRVQFTLRTGAGGAAIGDGWSLILQDGTALVTGVGGAGVGADGVSGLAVKFNYGNAATTAGIYATKTGGGSPALVCTNQIASFGANSSYTFTVRIAGGRLILTGAANKVWLNCDVSSVLPSQGYVGFGGGTGANTSLHAVDDVLISHPCAAGGAGTCGATACGDGVLNAVAEECDDNNAKSGDGCDASCKFEVDNSWGLYQRDNIWYGGSFLQPSQADFGNFKGLVQDALTLGSSIASNTIHGYRTWVYVSQATTLQFTIVKDDAATIYVNGSFVAGQPYPTNISVNTPLPAGWSRVDLMLYNGGSGGFLTLSKLFGSMVEKMSSGAK